MKLPRFAEKKIPKAAFVFASTFLLLCCTISLYYLPQAPFPLLWRWRKSTPSTSSSSLASRSPPPISQVEETATTTTTTTTTEGCDLFRGDWVPDPEAPYYSNETCHTIHEQQNCIKYGRPDVGFMKWRWKPQGCELPRFDPSAFLELVRGQSMAFVGDSVARNHMQSLLCLLSTVAHPVEDMESKFFFYPKYNFTIANIWSTFLVKVDSTGPDEDLDGAVHLHVDKPDAKWTAMIESYDYVIVSAGQWFYRPSFYHEGNRLVSCYRCQNDSIPKVDLYYGYRRAFCSSFTYLNSLANYKGMTFLRTYSPSHFEGAAWNKGGDCTQKIPAKNNETRLDGFNFKLHKVQVEEFEAAKEAGAKRGLKYHLLDITKAMLLRPDGHPSRYGHPMSANVTIRDCAHWCLPGPIDCWNDFFLEILRRERSKGG